VLVEKLQELRTEALAGRKQGVEGLGTEASTFYEHVADVAYGSTEVPASDVSAFKALVSSLVELLQDTIGSIDFWQSADKQKRLRGEIKSAIARAELGTVMAQRERVAVEVMKLAKNRHEKLLKAAKHAR
jgi:type I restriction enzyme R subunit